MGKTNIGSRPPKYCGKLFAQLFVLAAISGSVLLVLLSFLGSTPVQAAVGVNQQLNFQGRLLNAQGATVADGYYNLQFKIYQDGDGQSVGNTSGLPAGTLKWTESHLNAASQGVLVKNGFLSVQLGRVSPFGAAVDWNQDTLWLSMNIAGLGAACTPFSACIPDGEMTPMKRLSATPYALNAGMLGGLTSAQFIQNTISPQTANFNVTGSGTVGGALTVGGSLNVTGNANLIKPNTDSTTAFQIQAAGSVTPVLNVDTVNGRVGIGLAAPGFKLDVAGDINTSTQYRIAGGTALTNAALSFSAASAASIQSAPSQILNINGGNAAVTNTNGGNLNLSGGTGLGSGVNGLVIIATPTFTTTANDPNCYTGGLRVTTSCIIATASVNNSAAILVGFSTAAQSASLPDPTTLTAGRVVYVTAANISNDFTLLVNGGGTGNSIAMRQNTTATMIWNGADWTAAGASSSTTLQSAYDNTLQSAGGAELIVSKTGTTNGLTIRDSSANPVNGTLLSVQTASAAVLFSVNSNITEYSSNGGAEVAGGTSTTFPANSWSAVGGGGNIVSRHVTVGDFISTGQASVSVATAAINDGLKNRLNTSLTANTNYNVSFAARLNSGTFTDMNVYYSVDGVLNSVTCKLNQAVATSVWTKVNCTFAAPASGITANNAVIIRQASAAGRTFYVENLSVTIAADYNYASDGIVNDAANFATNWSFINAGTGAGSVIRSTSDGNDASDSASVTLTTGAANAGVRNRLAINPLPSTLYRVTTYAKLATGSFTDFKVRYSPIGSTGASGNYIDCVDYNTQTLTTTGWTKITCYINTDATVVTTPYVNFVETTATARTFGVDTFSMTLASDATPNVQVGGGVDGGPTTLFTLDKGASAPIASNNEALLGSMYYDTTLGKLQCYELDGWGACGSSPDNVITISPEYTNAVLHGTGVGTMTSDICSDTLNINDPTNGPAVCGTNETFNFYKWTSPQPPASPQTYSIFVTYQLPGTFKEFASGSTSLKGRTDSTNSTVTYQIYRSDISGLTACGSAIPVSAGVQTTWQSGLASGAADPSACGFGDGDSIVFKINMIASANANAYVSNLGFTFSNR